MNLATHFIKKLSTIGYDKDSIRFFGLSDKLQKQKGQLTTSAFAKMHKVNSGTLSYMLKGKRAIPLSMLENNIDFDKARCIIFGNKIPIKIPCICDEDLSYIVGFLRDGTVVQESKDEYVCAFYNTNKELIEHVDNVIRRLFDIMPELSQWNGVYRLRVRSKTLYLFFTLIFGITNDQSQWNTPEIIKITSDDNKKAYISGFFDAEGGCPNIEKNIDTKKKNMYAKFVQKNKEPLEFIKNHLEKNEIKTRNLYLEGGTKWVFKISNQSVSNFAKFVELHHPLKKQRLMVVAKLLSL